MLIAFIVGFIIALIGCILSFVTGNWYISFGISIVMAIISVLVASVFKNFSLILTARVRSENKKKGKELLELEAYSRILTLFALPNIIIAVFLYFKLFS
ncbi:hypothetical protein [Petroclostridium sp. X23]|uniref:hypothetical protein n=1 Tax=Petroclostridium sp. X23 TaxID=3045146 RepID=UPI0024ACB880|nr:hypothetical protein [Petroclostridium sp. X23]WHH60174.1 hypothetical protein QKW49_05415 [Petroclostridium sp. X23]